MIGTSVGHYRILSRIGAGGMGTVFLAEDTNLRRRVALKFLQADTAGSPQAAARLVREARAASALDHLHIATICEIGDHAGPAVHRDGALMTEKRSRLDSPKVRCRWPRSPASSQRWPMPSPPASCIAT